MTLFILQVYTGKYKTRSQVEVTSIWEHVQIGKFAAVALENYHKLPVICKVAEKHEATIQVNYQKGSWNKKWVPWLTGNKQPWTDVLPKDCIYLAAVRRLKAADRNQTDNQRVFKQQELRIGMFMGYT